MFAHHDIIERLEPHPETSHTEHGLTYLVDGWVRIEHGSPIVAEAGTITIVPAGVPHRLIEGRDVEYWDGGLLRRVPPAR